MARSTKRLEQHCPPHAMLWLHRGCRESLQVARHPESGSVGERSAAGAQAEAWSTSAGPPRDRDAVGCCKTRNTGKPQVTPLWWCALAPEDVSLQPWGYCPPKPPNPITNRSLYMSLSYFLLVLQLSYLFHTILLLCLKHLHSINNVIFCCTTERPNTNITAAIPQLG